MISSLKLLNKRAEKTGEAMQALTQFYNGAAIGLAIAPKDRFALVHEG